jgi:hypothetical protein
MPTVVFLVCELMDGRRITVTKVLVSSIRSELELSGELHEMQNHQEEMLS